MECKVTPTKESSKESSKDSSKIDVNAIIEKFRISDSECLSKYFKDIYKDLMKRSDQKLKGISRDVFTKYYNLPGIISDCLFNTFDKDRNEYIDLLEFGTGMYILFHEGYDKLVNFIFDFYDMDKDGYITKEDVKLILSYIPLNLEKKKTSSSKEDDLEKFKAKFQDRVKSQDEIIFLLEKTFGNLSKINKDQFIRIVETSCSEIFLFILVFLYERKPFTEDSLKIIEKRNETKPNKSQTPVIRSQKLIPSPSLNSVFSPTTFLKKNTNQLPSRESLLNAIKAKKSSKVDILDKYIKNSSSKLLKYQPVAIANEDNLFEKRIPVLRKKKYKSLKEFDNKEEIAKLNSSDGLPSIEKLIEMKKEIFDVVEYHSISQDKINDSKIKTEESNCTVETDKSLVVHKEGFLSKYKSSSETKEIKELWFQLIDKDLYFYKKKTDTSYKGMYHLSGIFLREQGQGSVSGKKLYAFSLIFNNKTKYFLTENKAEYDSWVETIRKVIGYSNLNHDYEFLKETIGKGRYGIVRLAKHIKTGQIVAIKVIQKSLLSNNANSLIRNEIEVLKISQHPNIIRLYNVYENPDFIYIIMEACLGKDLFTYFEARGFVIKEEYACRIVHQLATAIYYLHEYNIVHRDLKPENILTTSDNDEVEIRLLDFGLSKILSPGEQCDDAVGTISYVAPEVLLDKPHGKPSDIWSLGVIAFLFITGYLPFDDPNSDYEIKKKTISMELPLPNFFFQTKSPEAKQFVKDLLKKDPAKRPTIKEILEHNWFAKFSNPEITRKRLSSKSDCYNKSFELYAQLKR